MSSINIAMSSAAKNNALKIPKVIEAIRTVMSSRSPKCQHRSIAAKPTVSISPINPPIISASFMKGKLPPNTRNDSKLAVYFNINSIIVAIILNGNRRIFNAIDICFASCFIRVCHRDTLF